MLPLIVVVIVGVGLWRSMQLYRREFGPDRRPHRPQLVPQGARNKRIAKRVGIVAAAWAAVTGAVAFYRIDLALFAGMVVIVGGGIWIWKTADPMRIDMDELDRELMQLLEDES